MSVPKKCGKQEEGLLSAKSNGTVTITAAVKGKTDVSDSMEIEITNHSTGIQMLTKQISVYPNPVKDQLYYQHQTESSVIEIRIIPYEFPNVDWGKILERIHGNK